MIWKPLVSHLYDENRVIDYQCNSFWDPLPEQKEFLGLILDFFGQFRVLLWSGGNIAMYLEISY